MFTSAQTIDLIIKCTTGAVSVVLAICTIIAGIKSGKWKKLFNKENGKVSSLSVLMSIMEEVEKFKSFSAEEKKQYVLTKFNQYCIDSGLDYDAELTDTNVETLIDFSKNVNAKKPNEQEHRL